MGAKLVIAGMSLFLLAQTTSTENADAYKVKLLRHAKDRGLKEHHGTKKAHGSGEAAGRHRAEHVTTFPLYVRHRWLSSKTPIAARLWKSRCFSNYSFVSTVTCKSVASFPQDSSPQIKSYP